MWQRRFQAEGAAASPEIEHPWSALGMVRWLLGLKKKKNQCKTMSERKWGHMA